MNKSPLTAALAVAIIVTSFPSHADYLKVKASALSQQDAASLRGKTVAVVLHERESFVATTAGKAMFAMLGAAAMIKEGNDFVEKYQIPDPTLLIRDQLANTLRDQLGANVLPADTTVAASDNPSALAKAHPDSNYILSVRHRGSNYSYYPGKWDGYWVGNNVNVQLIETKSGRVLTKGYCYAATHKNPVRPSLLQLHENDAQLTKKILESLAWRCARQYALDGLKLAPDRAPSIPQLLADPLAGIKSAPAAAGKYAVPGTSKSEPEAITEPTPESLEEAKTTDEEKGDTAT